MFDLATAAQWQKAMRPDPQWLWYDTPEYGGGKITDSLETITNVLGVISQIPLNKGYSQPDKMGLYQPNSYGLYDSVGARIEFVLDRWKGSLKDFSDAATDPVGPSTTSGSRLEFGSWQASKSLAAWTMASVNSYKEDAENKPSEGHHYRYVIHLNPPKSFNGVWEDPE